jgi:hypothetical protein
MSHMKPTVNGKLAAAKEEAEAYHRLLDEAAQADAEEGIRQGLEDARKGRVRPIPEFFAEFEEKHPEIRSATLRIGGADRD